MEREPSIFVLAGSDGAGKSSVAGAAIRARGMDYFDPGEAARRILDANPRADLREANRQAWVHGKRLLEAAIARGLSFVLETTLGGSSIPPLLERASAAGVAVRVWYVGLEGPGLHVARVRARAADGGHDTPERMIRDRYDRSRENLIRLLPRIAELRVYDNSAEADPARGIAPRPVLILHARDGEIREHCAFEAVPQWAKPIMAAALRNHGDERIPARGPGA